MGGILIAPIKAMKQQPRVGLTVRAWQVGVADSRATMGNASRAVGLNAMGFMHTAPMGVTNQHRRVGPTARRWMVAGLPATMDRVAIQLDFFRLPKIG